MNVTKRNRTFLDYISTTTPKQRTALLRALEVGQVRLLSEIVLNCLRGTIPTTPRERVTLKAKTNILRKLVTPDITLRARIGLLIKAESLLPLCIRAFDRHESGISSPTA